MNVLQPLIGTIQAAASCDLYSTTPTTPTQTSGKISGLVTWPLIDFATTPTGVGTLSTSTSIQGVMLRFSTPITCNAILLLLKEKYWYYRNTSVSYWTTASSTAQTVQAGAAIKSVAGPLSTELYQGFTLAQTLTDVTAIFIPLIKGAGATGFTMGEVAAVTLTDMPETPIRDTYTITPTQSNLQTVTCQNGRQVQYYNSTLTYNVNMEYAWSDEGTKAAELTSINETRLLNGSPLIYIPAAPSAIDRPIYLVNVPQAPEIIHSDAKVYHITFQGVTQP